MATQDFRQLLQLSIKQEGVDKFTGPVESAETLLRPETLARLDAGFPGAYCIVIHDPAADTAIDVYLTTGAVADDSGKSVMVLFEPVARRRRTVANPQDGLGKVEQPRAMADFARDLLPGSAMLFPGVLLLGRLTAPANPLYVPLAEPDQAVARLRTLLATVAANVDRKTGALDDDGVGRALAAAGTGYQRGTRRSAGELLLVALRSLWDARKDLAAILGAGIKLMGGGSKE